MPLASPVPDLFSLDLFLTVAELGSIAKAAASHHVSQPAASMRLRALERSLGLELLDRSSGRARPTAVGSAVAGWAQPVMEAARALQDGAAALRSSGTGHLKVAASMTVAEYLVPTWLARLRAKDATVAVSLRMGNSELVAAMVRAGEADIGYVEGPDLPLGLAQRIVAVDDLVVVAAPSHPWARRRRAVGPIELAETALVVREPGSGTREVLERALGEHGLALRVLVELGSTTAIKRAIANGAGPGALSRIAASEEIASGSLAEVPVEDLTLTRSIRAVWAKGRTPPPAARLLLACSTSTG